MLKVFLIKISVKLLKLWIITNKNKYDSFEDCES